MKKWVIVLLHAGYWLMYIFFMTAVVEGMAGGYQLTPTMVVRQLFLSPMAVGAWWPGIISFYIFYFVLFDRFLRKRKVLYFSIASVLTAKVAALLTLGIMYLTHPTVAPFQGKTAEFLPITVFLAFIGLVHGIIASIMRGFVVWYEEIKIKAELARKNYEMELALMKAQINPHFLFNTINNIDVLILKDAPKASEYLNKLSDLMRFTLYESGADKISLSKELSYLEKFIELQKIRTSSPAYIHFDVRGNAEGILIEPMLLIPFVENAFKHSGGKKQEDAISINVSVSGKELRFDCTNAYSRQMKTNHSGLGNELIRRRLALLFPRKHRLEIRDEKNIYSVNLSIQLN